ncbi:porin [bacterium]|nr:porin [bacterium]MBU1990160.1 porin [bacterium]
MKISKISLGLFTALALSSNAFASDSTEIEALKKEIAELRNMTKQLMSETQQQNKESEKKIAAIEETQQTLIDETSNFKTGFEYTTVGESESYTGLGKAASKIYNSKSPLSIGGYAKMDYYHKSNEGSDNGSNIDVYRFIPYIGYKFSDNIIMNTEIEFEHGGIQEGATGDGYVVIEFLYLDFLINNNFNIRVGNQLMPMGLINEKHEPTLFTTVQRPNTSKVLIPSTWHENGIMAYGDITENLSYKAGAFSGLQLARGAGKGNNWLRESRLGSFRADNDAGEDIKLAGVARVDYTGINGLFTGVSTYVDSSLTMVDVHFDYQKDAFRTYGVYTQTNRSETVIGEPEKAKGGFINVGYDILSLTKSQKKMPIFAQIESVSAQDSVTGGNSVDSTDSITVGVNYFPHEQVVFKADYVMSKDNSKASNVDETDTFSLSMGFIF